jgi:hypothetical protein
MRLIYIAHRADKYDPQMGAANPDPAAIVVRESRGQISALFGFLTIACAVALARSVLGAHATTGRATFTVVFGGLLALFIVGWIIAARRPSRLEITQDAVRYVQRNGQVATLSRQLGDELRWVKELRGRTWRRGLTIVGTDAILLLGTFSRAPVEQACLARGWRFDGRTIIRR